MIDDGWGRWPSSAGMPTPIKHLAEFINGYSFRSEDWSAEGTPIIRIENLNGSQNYNCVQQVVDDRHSVRAGDLLFSWSGNLGTSFGPHVWDRPGDWYLNQHIFKVRPAGVHSRWLYWALRAATSYIEQQTTGIIGMVHVSKAELGSVPLPVPSLAEQRAIADYLDAETARIDALIAKKQQLIHLLEERWRAAIDAEFGELAYPIVPLRRFVRVITQGVSPRAGNAPYSPGRRGLLKLSAVHFGEYRPDENKELDLEFDQSKAISPRFGDLLVTRANTPQLVGDACAVREPDVNVVLCDLIYLLRLDDRLKAEFAAYALLTRRSRHEFTSLARGTSQSMVKLRGEDVVSIRLPVPSVSQQHEAVERLDAARDRIERAGRTVQRQMDLLAEHRQALITAAVTGEFAVQGAA